jgi:excisionase family DNA binding protein
VVRRHAHPSPSATKLIRRDRLHLLQNSALALATKTSRRVADTDPVLSTQEAAELVGGSRPIIAALIAAGEILLHQQAGNQRRVLRSAVLAWYRRERTRRRRALGLLGADLDTEVFARLRQR